MSRTITGTVYYPNGSPWAGGEVRARLIDPFETSTRVYPKREITFTLDSNGQIPAGSQLDTPDTGTARYLITTPDQANYEVYIATGPAVDLVTLLTIAGTAVAQDDLQTLLDAAALLSITEVSSGPYDVLATDEYLRCSGTGYTITLPAAGNNRAPFLIKNVGTGTITATPAGSDQINGLSSLLIYAGEAYGFIDVAALTWDAV
jgi:hypothetical protein